LGIGDWGLGIGDWAQSPIPNFFLYLNRNFKYEFSYFQKIKIIFLSKDVFK